MTNKLVYVCDTPESALQKRTALADAIKSGLSHVAKYKLIFNNGFEIDFMSSAQSTKGIPAEELVR